MKEIKVALFGVGGYAANYPYTINQHKDSGVTLVAAVDPFNKNCDMCPVYDTAEEMYANHQPDLVVVGTPINFHVEQTVEAFRRGCHVAMEKPMAANMDGVRKILAARDEAGKMLSIGFNMCADPVVRAAKADVQAGLFGKPLSMKTIVLWPRGHAYYARGGGWAGKKYAKHGAPLFDSVLSNATAHYLLAKADDGMNNPLMSIAHLTQAIVLKDDYIEARLLRAEALLKMGQLHEADEDIQMVLQSDAENENALLLRGRAKQMEGNDTAAEEDYLHLIALNPFNEQAYLALGALYINAKAYDKAIALFNEAIEVNPQFANAYHERGRAKLLSGDKEGAAADMKNALELNPLEVERLNGAFSNQEQESPRINILGI